MVSTSFLLFIFYNRISLIKVHKSSSTKFQKTVKDCMVYENIKPLALLHKALTGTIMPSDVIVFQGILKTENVRSLACVYESLQQ